MLYVCRKKAVAASLGEEAVVNIMARLIMRESINTLQFPRVRRLTTLALERPIGSQRER